MYRKIEGTNELQPVRSAAFGERYKEEHLEAIVEQNPHVLAEDEPLLIINRQPNAGQSGIPDLLAIDADGNLVIVELKRGRTPREVVAQGLEYAAWVAGQDEDTFKHLGTEYFAKRPRPTDLETAWREAFGQEAPGDGASGPTMPELNRRQRIILVLEGQDDRVRNVTGYLRRHGIDINVVEYIYYRTATGEEFLDIASVYAPEVTNPEKPDEVSLLREWSPAQREAYLEYKRTLMTADDHILVDPKKTGVSFYKQTRTGRVFIGTIASSGNNMRVWYRRDSLKDHLDLGAMEESIVADTPQNIRFTTLPGNNDHRFDFEPRPEDARIVARLILEHIVRRLE